MTLATWEATRRRETIKKNNNNKAFSIIIYYDDDNIYIYILDDSVGEKRMSKVCVVVAKKRFVIK